VAARLPGCQLVSATGILKSPLGHDAFGKVKTAGGVFQVHEDEPEARIGVGLDRRRPKRGEIKSPPQAVRLCKRCYSSKADANGRTAGKIAHHSPRDNSTIMISAAPIGRTISRWNWSRRAIRSEPVGLW
jgi:hypothetical protein